MRVGIDISVLCNKWDGIGTYTYEVLKYIIDNDVINEYYLYADRPLDTTLVLNERIQLKIDDGKNHLLWLLTKLPKYSKRDKIDVFWQPNFILPFRIKGMRSVVNVHDMSAYAYSEYASFKTNFTHKLFLKSTCRKADTILAISNNGAEEIVKYFPNVKKKVKTIYIGKRMFENGLDVSVPETEKILSQFYVNRNDYILFVGTLSPRKNAEVIVKGYFKYRDGGGNKKLVLAGNIASRCKNIEKMIIESKYAKDIIIAGYISDTHKRVLYYNAKMLLFPSRLEGFGFPILEAMQAEIPVITSNCSCMPEIAGAAAIYLNDINSTSEMAKRIFEVEQMPDLDRTRMIECGIKRVQYFDALNYPKMVLHELLNTKQKH